ncbi:MAG: Na+/H+ antiporter NhaA [Hyphomicrobiales bacterium]
MPHASEYPDLLPREPIQTFIDPVRRFLHIEATSGVALVAATLAALIAANSAAGEGFLAFWQTPVGLRFGSLQLELSLLQWINDFLMAIFFYVIGLEVKRELVRGELRDLRRAVLPLAAAVGGMIAPAAVYLLLLWGAPGERGWGIPMATDIAFVVGCLAVLGSRIPVGLRIMLLSLAIADDIGAILVIAVGYTGQLNWTALWLSALGIGIVVACMKLGIHSLGVYLILSLGVWFEVHASGIHATIAGVILGFLTPSRAWISERRLGRVIEATLGFMQGDAWRSPTRRYAALRQMERAARSSISPLRRFEMELHPWVAFVIMPIFALANAGVRIDASAFVHPVAAAVMLGLLIGKPVGVFLFSWLAVKTGLAKLPSGVGWTAVMGGGILAGIGFTMAIFIGSLALEGALLSAAKVGILAGSVASAVLGTVVLVVSLPKARPAGEPTSSGQ